MSPEVFIGLGSNLGDRAAFLRFGLVRLARIGTITLVSAVYETQAWGKTDQPDFLNAVCSLHTGTGDPVSLLGALKEIEAAVGRKSSGQRWGARPLDLDILFWGSLVLESEQLTIPHPGIAERRIVLEPLVEIAPDLRHPTVSSTVREMLQQCTDQGQVIRLGNLGKGEYFSQQVERK